MSTEAPSNYIGRMSVAPLVSCAACGEKFAADLEPMCGHDRSITIVEIPDGGLHLPPGYKFEQLPSTFVGWFHSQPRPVQDAILDKLAEAMGYAPASPNELQPPMCSRLLEDAKDFIHENGLEIGTYN